MRQARMRSSCAAVSACLAVLPLHAPLVAQPTAAATGQIVRAYAPDAFARFSPRTALDMLELVPGFVIASEEQRRGLGALSENVLINGRPIAGKSNDAVDTLSRITADDVLRIEISASGAGEGAGVGRQIANVVTKTANRTKGQFTFRPSTRLRNFSPALSGDASVSAQSGPFNYSVGIRNDGLRTGASGPSRILNPDGQIADLRDERFIERSDRPRVSADVRYEGPGTLLAGLRGSYQRFYYRFRETSERTGAGLPDRTRFLTQREDDYRYELGGDVDFQLGPGRLKLIALHAAESSPIDTRAATIFADGSDQFGSRFLREADERETVFRSEYRWTSGDNDWQASAERALNSLDNVSTVFDLLPDGSFEETPFPGGSGDVRERRYNAALTWARRFSPTFSLRASLGGEISQLKVAGSLGGTRTFERPKGYLSAAWQASPGLRVNAKIERRVGQISFFDFLASRNLTDSRENAANPDLVPPQSWDAETELSRDLGPLGSTTVRVYGRRITDLVGQLPVGETQEALGNLDVAHLYGVDWKTSLVLDRWGWTGGRLDARLQFQKSAVDDPVTGRSRPISNDLVRILNLSLRHDIPGTAWAWGGALVHTRNSADFRIDETARYRQGPLSGSLYIENKNVAGLTVRTGISNLISSRQELDRFIFVNRRDGPLLSVERRRRSSGPELTLTVRGNF